MIDAKYHEKIYDKIYDEYVLSMYIKYATIRHYFDDYQGVIADEVFMENMLRDNASKHYS